LVILGPGYNLNQNPDPYTQADALSAQVSTFRIANGAAGSIVSGLYFGNTVQFDTVNNVMFQSNACQLGINLNRSNNINIAKCYVKNTASGTGAIDINYCTGIQINNNLIEKTAYGYLISQTNTNTGLAPNLSSVTAEYNTFVWNTTLSSPSTALSCMGYYTNYASEMIVRNNIFFNKQVATSNAIFTSYAATYATVNMTNNVVYDSSFASTTNVVLKASPSAMFQYWGNTSYALDYICQNKAGSPALGAGTGGSNCGMYGGGSPYSISGLSIIPNISLLQMPTIGTTGYGIDVRIKAKANQ
jgi:hypothetical protein